MKIVFRVDASKELGIGHFMRCLALSEEFTRRGHVCIFFSKIDHSLIWKIKNYDINHKIISKETSWRKELVLLTNFLKENNIDWVVTDHYKIDSNYIRAIIKNGVKVLSIDDTAQIYYYSNIVVNQNIGAEKIRFESDENTIFLLGPDYIMIRDSLLKRNEKKYRKKVKKILVTMGGTDNYNLTKKILKMIELSHLDKKIDIILIIGPLNTFSSNIKDYVKKSKLKVNIIESPKDISKIYLDSDIAISAGGSTCYELAYFGIPNMIITIANNQLEIAKELYEKHISIYLGDKNKINLDDFRHKINELIINNYIRKKMIEGKGVEFPWGANRKTCTKCGAKWLPEDFEHCGKCGAKL